MIKNHLTFAFRHFKRNKLFTLVNVGGLAIGISAAIVIYLIVQFEFGFEAFRKDRDKIYRAVTEMTFPGEVIYKNGGVEMPLAEAVRREVAGVEMLTHFVRLETTKVAVNVPGTASPTVFKKQEKITYADEYYFQFFEYHWVAGSDRTALKQPYHVVLTDKRASVYFGNRDVQDIIGSQITYSDSIVCTVSGIVTSTAGKPTDIDFEEFISLSTTTTPRSKEPFGYAEWSSTSSSSQLFLKPRPGAQPEKIAQQLTAIRDKNTRGVQGEDNDKATHYLQPLTDIHFNTEYNGLGERQAHKPTLYGLLIVGGFLLSLACINFINLTTAQSSVRAKEIGIRKTLGSGSRTIIYQFLSQTFLLVLAATLLSIALIPWLIKVFSDFIPSQIGFRSVWQVHVIVFIVLLMLVLTGLSGLYPGWVLSKFKPVAVLKDQLQQSSSQSGKVWLRKTLTVAQFVIAQFLVIATLVVGRQIRYSLNKDLGYKKDAIVYFKTPSNFSSDMPDARRFILLEKIKAIPAVQKIGMGDSPPAHFGYASMTFTLNTGKSVSRLMVQSMRADPAYFDIYKLKLKAGRFPEISDTTTEYLINEAYSRTVGFSRPEDALGKFFDRGDKQAPIVGVLADFHAKSTREPMNPIVFSNARTNANTIHILLRPQDGSPGLWKETINRIGQEFRMLFPDNDFEITFFDETIAAFYKAEQDARKLLNWAAALSIFISFLGLLSMVIHITNSRVKEIGIRKVLGASVIRIMVLLSKDLVSLVILAFVISAPLSWLAMKDWLQGFAFRTELSWTVFATCGVGMLGMALIVLGIRTAKAAGANPVKSLRTE